MSEEKNIKEKFREWQKKHKNIMTPEIVGLKIALSSKKQELFIVEISKGTGLKNQDIFGVSVFEVIGNEFVGVSAISKLFSSKKDAYDYVKKLIEVLEYGN